MYYISFDSLIATVIVYYNLKGDKMLLSVKNTLLHSIYNKVINNQTNQMKNSQKNNGERKKKKKN